MTIVTVYLVTNGLAFEFTPLNSRDQYLVMVGVIFLMNVFTYALTCRMFSSLLVRKSIVIHKKTPDKTS